MSTPAPSCNVNITLSGESANSFAVVPGALDCSWLETSRTEFEMSGVCRGWLKRPGTPSSGTLRLAPLVGALLSRGATPVTLILTASKGELEVPPGWKTEGEGRRSSYLTFTSSNLLSLPGDVAIPLERPPSLILPVILIFLVLLDFCSRMRGTTACDERARRAEE